jgi:flagellar basal body-associated protein FliL
MYAGLWRILPGPVWVRILILVVLAAVVLSVLAFWVFPWIDDLTAPVQDVTVDQ